MDNTGHLGGSEQLQQGENFGAENGFDSTSSVEFAGNKEQADVRAENPVNAEKFIPGVEKQTTANQGAVQQNNQNEEQQFPEYVAKPSQDFTTKTSSSDCNTEKKVIEAGDSALEDALKIKSPYEMMEAVTQLKKAFRDKILKVGK